MSLEMERRVAMLEQEMMDLRHELESLKRQQSVDKTSTLNARKSIIEQSTPKLAQNLKPDSNLSING